MDKRSSIINVITNPLGFFALSLLIVEGFLGIVLIGSGDNLPAWAKEVGIFIAAGAFVLVVVLVTLLVWFKPKHLTFGGREWSENESMQYGVANNPKTKLEIESLPGTNKPTRTTKKAKKIK